MDADEAFYSGTAVEITPITKVNESIMVDMPRGVNNISMTTENMGDECHNGMNGKFIMKFQENSQKIKFKIVITVGDESGIGPEIILKALYSNEIPKDIDIFNPLPSTTNPWYKIF